jgi:CheY-like chemotaxis protein
MSETVAMPPLGNSETKAAPTVYFIDDSATMREVIKIAFRRENIHIITCGDAASALNQFEQHPPDVVITDVIMPDQDGYSVCSQIKQHPQFGKTPVILMSGVVNKSVADRAVAVQADELVRKPFQPQELISRVRNLLSDGNTAAPTIPSASTSGSSLDSFFAPPAAPPRVSSMIAAVLSAPSNIPTGLFGEAKSVETAWPRAVADDSHQPIAPAQVLPGPGAPPRVRAGSPSVEIIKLKAEIAHLELLIKKLQTELQIERQYNQALELHVRTLTQIE